MKKPFLLSILFLSLIFQVAAQNYQTVNSGKIASFKNAEDEIKFIRIDSVNFDTDSILVPFSNRQQYSDECFTPYGSHWLGKEITITPYGTNIIKNKDGYPFYINTQAELGESFSAFILFGMQVVMATVTDHDTLTFLGVQDSVKTYTLQVFNDYNQPVNHPLNGVTFKISKDHGFVQTLNFSLFPDLSNWNPSGEELLESYDLVGLASPELGVQNLTWMEVHDFQPGDEIHVFYNIYMWGSIPAQIEEIIFRYLSREDYDDSVSYTIERIKIRFYENYKGSIIEFIHDTITETYTPYENFDKLPGEVVMDDYFLDYALYYRMNKEWRKAKIKPLPGNWLFLEVDDCWIFNFWTGHCFSDYYWYEGLGGPYHYCDEGWSKIIRELVYYKKGDEEWGTPLVIVGINEVATFSDVKVYPNPARHFLNVQISEATLPAKIGFYNVMGSLLREFVLTEANQQISLQQLTPGLYFYRIVNEKEVLGSGKLVVE